MNYYPENLLQWIWESIQFDPRSLVTEQGLPVQLINQGVRNHSDGPDFKQACCRIGELEWYGTLEIHWKSSDWYRHNHHRDANYNNVILHLVAENDLPGPVKTSSGHLPHTLQISNYLTAPLKILFDRFERPDELPCAPHIHQLNRTVFLKQLERAHIEYFEEKVEHLMVHYPPELTLSGAWKAMLAIGLFDGLGISHNRAPMRKLAGILNNKLELFKEAPDEAAFIDQVYDIAFQGFHFSEQEWVHKGSRPANHPAQRVKQAASLYYHLNQIEFKEWVSSSTDPGLAWKKLLQTIKHKPGKQRSSVLFMTVLVPAVYILGQLLHSASKKQWAYQQWMDSRMRIPSSVEEVFTGAGVSAGLVRHNAGTIYQKKAYCDQRRCNRCAILKSALHS